MVSEKKKQWKMVNSHVLEAGYVKKNILANVYCGNGP